MIEPRSSRLVIVACVAVLAALVLAPLHSVKWFQSPEGPDYLLRVELLVRELAAQRGHPRWLPELAGGHGYPLFHYYAPGSIYLAAPLHALGLPAADALRVVLVLAALAGGAGMVALGRLVFRHTAAGLLGAALILSAAFFGRSLYADGNLSQVIAFCLSPVALWALLRAGLDERAWGLGAVAYGGFVCLHTVSALTFSAAFAAALAACLLLRAEPFGQRARRLARSALAMAAGLVLSSWFWLPAMVEKPLVQSEVLLTGFFDYRRGFLGGSVIDAAVAGVGVPLLLVALTSLVAAVAFRRGAGTVAALTALGALPLALAARAAEPLWEHAPLLRYVQPNRLAGPATLLLALAGAALAARLSGALRRPAVMPVAALALALGVGGMPDARAVRELPASERRAEPFETCGFGEYLPRTVLERPAPGGPIVRLEQGAVLDATVTGASIRATVQTPAPITATLRQFDFPGWRAHLDGRPVQHGRDHHGRITVAVPAGLHRIDARFGHTPVRALASFASTWAFMIALAFGSMRLLARVASPRSAKNRM